MGHLLFKVLMASLGCLLVIAGAEAVVEFSASGPARFAQARAFIDQTLANTIAVGPLHPALHRGRHPTTAGFAIASYEGGKLSSGQPIAMHIMIT